MRYYGGSSDGDRFFDFLERERIEIEKERFRKRQEKRKKRKKGEMPIDIKHGKI